MLRILIYICTCSILLITPAVAQKFDIKPFILYEQAAEKLEIDGVSSGYKFGVIGLSTTTPINNKINLKTDFGLSYVPSEKITFGGATFTGAFNGQYFSTTGRFNIKTLSGNKIYFNQSFSHRNTNSGHLNGEKNNAILTGTAVNIINAYDTIFNIKYAGHKRTNLTIGAGFHLWSFKARGTAANLSDTVRAIKNINAVGIDPLFQVLWQTKAFGTDVNIDFEYRSLNSKFNTGIGSLNIRYKLSF